MKDLVSSILPTAIQINYADPGLMDNVNIAQKEPILSMVSVPMLTHYAEHSIQPTVSVKAVSMDIT